MNGLKQRETTYQRLTRLPWREFAAFLGERGWQPDPKGISQRRGRVGITYFLETGGNTLALFVPTDERAVDYPKHIEEAVTQLAFLEGRDFEGIALEVLNPGVAVA